MLQAGAFIGFAVYGGVCVIPSLILFIKRRKIQPIASRGWEMVVLSQCFFLFHFGILAGQLWIYPNGDTSLNCSYIVFPLVAFVPVGCMPYLCRALRLYILYRVGDLQLKLPRNLEISSKPPLIYRMRWLADAKFGFAFVFITLVISIGVALMIQYLTPTYPDPYTLAANICSSRFYIFVVLQILVFFCLAIVLVYYLFQVQDAYSIKLEFQLNLIVAVPLYILYAISANIHIEPDDVTFGIICGTWLFSVLFPLVLSYMNERWQDAPSETYQIMPASSEEDGKGAGPPLKPIRNRVTSFLTTRGSKKPVQLSTILDNPASLAAFERAAVKLFCVESVLFVKDVRAFKTIPQDTPEQKDFCQLIASRYFRPFCFYEINVSGAYRAEVLRRIDEGQIDSDIFEAPYREVTLMLQDDILPRWRGNRAFLLPSAATATTTTTERGDNQFELV